MSFLSLMSEEEIRYVCSAIPAHHAIDYFMANPKEFVKIRPGFRMKKASLAKLDISNLLFRYRSRDFIEFFIEKIVGDWLDQIEEHHEKCIADGDSKEMSMMNTLPFSFFANNIGLFLKLVKEEYSEETTLILEAAVKKLKENSDNIESQQKDIETKDAHVNELRDRLESSRVHAESIRQKLAQAESNIRELRNKDKEIDELKLDIEKKTSEIERMRNENDNQSKIIQELSLELTNTANAIQLLDEQIRADVARQNEEKKRSLIMNSKPKRPVDMDEFTEHLLCNFESLGVAPNETFLPLLKTHLSYVLFEGTPIIVSRLAGLSLMRCVSNSLIGRPDVETLCFSERLSIEEIEDFMFSAGRVMCLDSFIGNFNESALIPLFDRHKGKIVFLTYSYDRMLKYISKEFLKCVQHISLSRIAAFNNPAELTEYPLIIEEAEFISQIMRPDSRFSPLLREILSELGYQKNLTEYMCATVANENDLCRKLAFDILPYCVDVLQIAPFNTSERLNKYSGLNGRCPYKDLFRRWFV